MPTAREIQRAAERMWGKTPKPPRGGSVPEYYIVGGAGAGAGGGQEDILDFGTYGPAAPTIGGLTLAWDFDFGYEPTGPMRAEIPSRAGTDTNAFMIPLSGDLEVMQGAGATRFLRFDTAKGTAASILNGLTAINASADAPFTLVLVGRRRNAGADHTLWDVSSGLESGNGVDTLQRYRLRFLTANTVQWSRANASNISHAAPAGTPSLVVPNVFVGRGSLSGDTISRGMLNGGAKASSAARSVTDTTFDFITVGAQCVWSQTSNGFPTYNQFADLDLYRVLLYAGSGADGDMDTLHTAFSGAYPA